MTHNLFRLSIPLRCSNDTVNLENCMVTAETVDAHGQYEVIIVATDIYMPPGIDVRSFLMDSDVFQIDDETSFYRIYGRGDWFKNQIQQWQAQELDEDDKIPPTGLPFGRVDNINGKADPRKPVQQGVDFIKVNIEMPKKCECGIEAIGGGMHSDWCPKYE